MSYRPQKRLEIKAHRGLDLALSEPHVSRATYMRNIENRDGFNQKRHGWENVLALSSTFLGEEHAIRGFFEIKLNAVADYLVIAGRKVRFISASNVVYSRLLYTFSEEPAEHTRFLLFTHNECFYLLGGKEILVITKTKYTHWFLNSARKAFNNMEYAKTPHLFMHGLAEGSSKEIQKQMLEHPNLLSNWRTVTFWLKKDDTAPVNEAGECTFKLGELLDFENTPNFKVERLMNGEWESLSTEKVSKIDGTFLQFKIDGQEDYAGSINITTDTLNLRKADFETTGDSDNIRITYCRKARDTDNPISKCSFGVIFGVEGRLNQLFVSGNPDYPNREWHSAMDDFTYFPDINYKDLGSKQTKITGYQLLADNALAVFKETSATEPSLFIRTGKFEKLLPDDEFEQAIFSDVTSFIGEGSYAPQGSCFFNGEPIIISRNGVYAIKANHNVASTERYAVERGLPINRALAKEPNLQNAKSIVHNGRLYIAINNKVYVADSRYIYDELGNYEWWVWDNMPVESWGIIENEVHFGTPFGNLCKFGESFEDKIQVSGVFSPSSTTEDFTEFTSSSIGFIENGDKCILFDTMIYIGKLFKAPTSSDLYNVSTVPYSGIRVAKNPNYSGDFQLPSVFNPNNKIANIACGTFYVIENGEILRTKEYWDMYDAAVRFYVEPIYEDINPDATLYFKPNIKENGILEAYIKLVKGGGYGEITTYTMFYDKDFNYPMVFGAKDTHIFTLEKVTPVVCEWQSTLLDLGASDHTKVLNYITIDADTQGTWWGYETRKGGKSLLKADKGLDFGDVDFGNLDFATTFKTNYTKRVCTPPFNFMQLKYKHETNGNCCVRGFTVGYKYISTNMGVN